MTGTEAVKQLDNVAKKFLTEHPGKPGRLIVPLLFTYDLGKATENDWMNAANWKVTSAELKEVRGASDQAAKGILAILFASGVPVAEVLVRKEGGSPTIEPVDEEAGE